MAKEPGSSSHPTPMLASSGDGSGRSGGAAQRGPISLGSSAESEGERTSTEIRSPFATEGREAESETTRSGRPAGAPGQVDRPTPMTPALVEMSGTGLTEALLREAVVTPDQLNDAQHKAQAAGERLANTLAKLGYIEETQLVQFLSRQYGVPSINVEEVEISEDVIRLIPRAVAERHALIPVNRQGSSLIIAMTDPSNIYAMDDVKFLTGYNVEVVVASESSIKKAQEEHYGTVDDEASFEELIGEAEIEFDRGEDDDIDLAELQKSSEEAPVVRLVNLILVDAIKRGASDIHIEPFEREFRVRYRIDGVLHEIMRPPLKLKAAITSRVKIMSELDIAERRLPQDGRIKLVMGKEREVDFRVSVLPTLFGEKIVLRILDKTNLQLDMTKLGFDDAPLAKFKAAIAQPWGMVLVTGPTGSGKTTTLYSALQELNKMTENICTAEDPVEFNLPGINQVQVHEGIGFTFATALRSFLRQDPDIIMVGEIRDFETAEIAVKAALTGHMVLSTLHTNDAPSTVNRLLNMGVEPFLVTASVNLILAQRLARKVCQDCKEPIDISNEALLAAGFDNKDIGHVRPMRGKGCRLCNDTGYRGRIALYEVMPLDDELKECVLQGYSSIELKREAIRLGMQTLRAAGLQKVRQAQTTLEEVLRVTRAD